MHQFSIFLLLIAGQAGLCLSISANWDCSKYYNSRTVKTSRLSYCYKLTSEATTISLEGQDPLLMNRLSSRTTSEKVLFCAKAAQGRGFRSFSLKDGGNCTVGGAYSYFSCSYNSLSRSCSNPTYPCIRYLTTSCQCGTSSGLGGSNYYNRYSVSTSYISKLGMWLEVEDVFNNTVEMFNATSPKYIHLYETYESAMKAYVNDSKICGVNLENVGPAFISPKNGPGPILLHFQLTVSFFNLTIVREKLKHFPYHTLNVTEFSIRQISGNCKEDYRRLYLNINGGTSFTSPIVQKRSGFPLQYSVSSSCVTPLRTNVTLKIASISKDGYISNFTTFCSIELVNLISLSHICQIPPLSLNEGLHYVIGEARTLQDPSMHGFDYIFMNITKGDLFAHITEATGCVHVLGILSYLNASGSYDKNEFATDLEAVQFPNDLRYTWVCYKTGDSMTATTPTEARNLPIVESGVPLLGRSGGCFGSGPGRLRVTTRATYFESSYLTVGVKVFFRVFIEKDERFAFVTKSCLITPAPEMFSIRCKFNCGPLMKTTARIGLEPVCEDPAGCSITLVHSWKFFIDTEREIDNGDGTTERVWQPYYAMKTLTESTNIYIVVEELSFEQNKTYRAQHIVKNDEGGIRVTNYNFTTNTFPHSGTCEADKTTLQAGIETVYITCRDWVDEQPYLSYEAWILPHNTAPRLVYFGNSTSFKLWLPVGDSANNFTLRMEIKVFDIYESTSFFMNFTVIEPIVEDPVGALFNLVGQEGDDEDANEQETAQKSIATLSLLGNNFASNVSVENKTLIRNLIISKMSNFSANNTQSISQVTGVLIDSTSKTDELSSEGQMQSIQAAFGMSESLKNDNSTDDPAIFEQVGTTLLHLTGNVLDGAATNNASTSGSGAAKALGETALNTSNTISSMLIGKMMGGEKAKTLLTPSLGLEISKTKSDKLPETYAVNGGGVDVPPVMKSLIANASECTSNETCLAANAFVSTKMLFSNSNPYTWGNSSLEVKSPVVSLDYLTSGGDTIPVGGLDSDFKLSIPTKPTPKPNKTSEFPNFVTPNTDCAMHKFYIANNDTAFETIINFEEETFVTVFVRHNMRPTEEKYDYVFHHPNLSSCVEPPERDNCTGVFDFTECMGLNRTSEKLSEERCENVTIPYIGPFSNNTNLTRGQETCIDYYNAVTCPVVECNLNSRGNSSGQNISQIAAINRNHSSLCGNLTNGNHTSENSTSNNKTDTCQKVKDFLYCKNASMEKYEKCKGLLTKKKLIYGKYDNCSENIYRTFFGLDIFRQGGWYYASICYPARQKHVPTTPKPTTPKPTTQVPTTRVPTTETDGDGDGDSGGGWSHFTPRPTTPKPTTQVPTTEPDGDGDGGGSSRRRGKGKNDRKKRSFNSDRTKWMKDDILDSYEGNVVDVTKDTTEHDVLKIERDIDFTSKYALDGHPYDSITKESQSDFIKAIDEKTKNYLPFENQVRSNGKEKKLSTFSEEKDYDYDSFLDSEEEAFYSNDGGAFGMNTEPRVLIRSRRETTPRKCAVVEEKPAPTTPPPPTDFPPVKPQVFNASSSLNYSFDINLFTCLFWNATTESWSTNGCQPHRNSTPTLLICMCNHLTSFGADMLVAPNPIDFDEVFANFANLGETGNFSVMFTIIGLFLLYALAVVLARRADKRDVLLVSKTRVGSIDPSCGGYNYEIAVSTGTFRGSGTTANVALTMIGEKGTSQTIPLVDETGSSEELLSRGNVAYLMVNTPEDIGDINYIRIWHNNKGNDPAWFMRQITIRDVVSNRKWSFLHNDWLAVDRADGKIDRRIYSASESEKSKFKTLFYSHTAKSFSDKHLWISVILRPPSNPFTRVQRVTCCLSLLLCAMLANAMFYQNGGGSEDTLKVGPFKLSLKQIIVGIESGLIVAPVNILIITLFRKARPKTKAAADKMDDTKEKYSSPKDQPNDGKKRNDKSNKSDPENNKTSKEKVKKKGFPHWCIYIAYFLCAISVLVSATFVIFYSMMWGTEKSNEWITSVLLSLIQDILLLQPLKVVILAMVLSAIFRKPPEEDPEDELNIEQQKSEQQTAKDFGTSSDIFKFHDINPEQYEPLDSEKVEDAQDYQNKKNTLRSTIKEIVWHLVFILLVSVAVFGSQSSHRYKLHDHLDKVFSKTEQVTTADRFWSWCETVLIPGLYDNDWYNDRNFTDERGGFISNKKGLLISMPRMRQVRVKAEECTATRDYPKLQEMFPKCYSDYSMSKADESSPLTFSNPQASTLNDSVLNGEIGFERMCLQPFMVQSADKLGTLPLVTDDATYSGSGMVADLGYDNSTASEVIVNLKADQWITRQTRGVFVEFVIFEPTSKLYAFARFIFEQKSIGSFFSSKSIEPYALYGTGSSTLDSVILFIQFILIIFILVCLVKEIIKMVKLRIPYFKDAWNIHQLLMLGFTIGLVVLTLLRDVYVANLIKTIQDNPYARMSFDYVKYGTDVWKTMASLVVFLSTLKLLKLLNFNKKILTFVQVLKVSRPFLISYAFFFFVVFSAFAQCGNLIFGQQLLMYSNFMRSFVNVFQMALGKGLFFHDLKDITATLGPLFILCYFFVTTILLVNFFVSILNDSYADGSKKMEDDTNEEAIMAAFMSAYLKSSLKDISRDLKQMRSRPGRGRGRRLKGQQGIAKAREEKRLMQLENEVQYFLY